MPNLVERLGAIQAAHKWTDPQFSERMGVTRVLWQQVKKGDRKFGAKTLRAILKAFPELGDEILAYLGDEEATPEVVAA